MYNIFFREITSLAVLIEKVDVCNTGTLYSVIILVVFVLQNGNVHSITPQLIISEFYIKNKISSINKNFKVYK